MSKPILCVDFDGVIHSYTSGWQGHAMIPDAPVPGALQFLLGALLFFDVQIYSSRSCRPEGIEAMQAWLIRYAVKEGLEAEIETLGQIKFPTEKPSAFLTLDDRAIQFDGTFPSPQTLLGFKPWNKR